MDHGEVLYLRTVSGSPDDPVPPGWIPPEIPPIFAEVHERGPGSHIITGPVFVRGARPGSTLQVDILSIRLGASYGYNVLLPNRGIFPDAVEMPNKSIIPIDRATGMASVLPGLKVSTRPFFGILGVAPPLLWNRIGSTAPNSHGGNLDNKELVAGTTLLLPVWAEGALFSAGDGHAAQGDGEVNISAIETCLEGEFRLKVRRDISLSLPIAVTPTHLIAMGFDEDLYRAAQIAVRSLLDLLHHHCAIAWLDAYRLASITADLRVTQVVNGAKGIHVMVERTLLEQLGCQAPFMEIK